MNCSKSIIIMSAIQILFSAFTVALRANAASKNSMKEKYIKIDKPGTIADTFVKADSIIQTFSLDLNEQVRVIVQFSEPPLSRIKSGEQSLSINRKIVTSKIEQQHLTFISALSEIENRIVLQPRSAVEKADTKIVFKYINALNGMTLQTRRWIADEIKRLPYVKKVYRDGKVNIFDEVSNKLIGADKVWDEFGLTGRGVRVGIIDTGVDYRHPDLGAGIGPGYKVRGGYDFINDDADPMDDEGHGTHVAGIVAANGTTKGVAPDADLYAFKVLDQYGSGELSTVIAGIERALDPDQNPESDDAVDIINLSLGGTGDPDDPLSQAVDNASAAGIVCVVAAGNDGSYQSIGSPGCARTAVTVGASDNSDQIANFSSRGPSNAIYAIKPDLVAPGVAVESTQMGGGYIALDGTSMAAPHVSGCAALMLELYPEFAPSMIKSLLMSTAKDLGEDVWTQGSGRVDIYEAAQQTILISPPTLSWGIVDLQKSIYSFEDTLWIYNNGLLPELYSLQLDAPPPDGLAIRFERSTVAVNAKERAKIIVSINIDNRILPLPRTDPPAYSGKIIISSATDVTTVPYAIIKSPMLLMYFDEEPFTVLIHDRIEKHFFIGFPGDHFAILLPQNTYDLVVHYLDHRKNTYIIRENIHVLTFNLLHINKSEAKNRIRIVTLDEQSREIDSGDGVGIITHKTSKFGIIGNHVYAEEYFSDFSSNYLWEWHKRSEDYTARIYTFNGYLKNGCDADIKQINDPADFKHIIFNYHVDKRLSSVFPKFWFCSFFKYVAMCMCSYSSIDQPLSPPFTQEAYLTPIPYADFNCFPLVYSSVSDLDDPFDTTTLLATPLIFTKNNKMVELWIQGDTTAIDTFDKTVFNAAYGAPHWFGKLDNRSTRVSMRDARGTFLDLTKFFTFPLKDYVPLWNLQFELCQDENIVKSGEIYELTDFSIPVSPGQYTLRIPTEHYFIQDRRGKAIAQLTFDTRKWDSNPPAITSFKIFAGDEITDLIKKTDDGVISFSLADESALADVRLHIKSHESETWVPLDAQCRGTVYTAPVPQDWAEGFTSLKITAQDIHENILEYIVNPAFHFGDSVQTIIAPDSAATISDSPKVFSLGQNYPNPFNPVTTIRYCIPEKSSVILAVYDILGRQAALLVDEEKPAGDHKIQFDSRNLASGVYIYVLQAGDFCAQKKSILLR